MHVFIYRQHRTRPTFSSRSLICLLWISVLSSRSRILCKYSHRKRCSVFLRPTKQNLTLTASDGEVHIHTYRLYKANVCHHVFHWYLPGAPGAAAPSSPGGSGSRTLGSSSASAASVSPPPSAARPSEARSEVHRTLWPGGRRRASSKVADGHLLLSLSF